MGGGLRSGRPKSTTTGWQCRDLKGAGPQQELYTWATKRVRWQASRCPAAAITRQELRMEKQCSTAAANYFVSMHAICRDKRRLY